METKDGFIIRPIKETDNAQMARLIRCVIDEFGVSRTGTVYDDPVTDCISQSVEYVNAEYWVIDYGGEIQGGCGFYPTKGLPGKCAEIVKYYLSPAVRGKGLGSMILDLIVRRAKGAGYTSLYIETFPSFGKAIDMYKERGFQLLDGQLGDSGHTATSIFMLKVLTD